MTQLTVEIVECQEAPVKPIMGMGVTDASQHNLPNL